MKIIPVIDLSGGQVVHAVRGQRAHYQPLKSRLCSGNNALEVAAALLKHVAAETLYIADLDALSDKPPQTALIDRLLDTFPDIGFWLDNGYSIPAHNRCTPVVGSESLNLVSWAELQNRSDKNWILSLDFFNGELKGCAEILQHPECWPDRVIVMCLDHVGNFNGPDWARLQGIIRIAPPRTQIIAAGGIRHRDDVVNLEKLGVAAVLVASALHAGLTL